MKNGYLAEKISKRLIEDMASFFLLLIKRGIERRLVRKEEQGIDDFRSSQLNQIAKDIIIKRFTISKACSREKTKSVTIQFAWISEKAKGWSAQSHKRLFKEIKNVIHQRASRKFEGIALEPSQQKPKVEMGLSSGKKST